MGSSIVSEPGAWPEEPVLQLSRPRAARSPGQAYLGVTSRPAPPGPPPCVLPIATHTLSKGTTMGFYSVCLLCGSLSPSKPLVTQGQTGPVPAPLPSTCVHPHLPVYTPPCVPPLPPVCTLLHLCAPLSLCAPPSACARPPPPVRAPPPACARCPPPCTLLCDALGLWFLLFYVNHSQMSA